MDIPRRYRFGRRFIEHSTPQRVEQLKGPRHSTGNPTDTHSTRRHVIGTGAHRVTTGRPYWRMSDVLEARRLLGQTAWDARE
jgi:hypothetical protein